ncbi:DUF1214 domain-containing protein [Sediminitomix flava]|uniref:DUF1254 domain-containing protein n=1 Tax=Sediminitomix flava TaxID=379075 RepID=A0A315Z9D5_SEDFL|nr:DUF1214 domain-containing protein [Sediminitomix flava]PWJ41809.1 hypothetical protein BC781_10359 [Sediminitomix flava]
MIKLGDYQILSVSNKNIIKVFKVLIYSILILSFLNCEEKALETNLEEEDKELDYSQSGYPTKRTIAKMYSEMAFHGATQAFLWGVAILVNDAWRQANLSVAGPLDFVSYNTLEEKYNIITSNLNTPYMVAFPNLKETGPLIIEVPAGPTAGILNDIESRHIADLGLVGKDKGFGGKYLVLHESWDEPNNHGADFVLRSKTNLFWVGTRILSTDSLKMKELEEAHKLYPLGEESNTKVISIGEQNYKGWHPEGMAFWKALNEIIQIEDFPEEDRYMLQFLQRVGIEKGTYFNPTIQQKQILAKAARHGKAMAESLSNGRRFFIQPFYGDKSKWTVPLKGLSNSDHINKNGMKELDGLVSYCWEAFSMSDGMMKELVGVGSKYLSAYEDAEGNWLDGSNTYQLTIPPNVPAEQFWSFIVYAQETRSFIDNKDRNPGVSSRDELVKNDDGSITITIGPEKPKEVSESNFIYSNQNEGWFAYFRCYAPTQAFFDKTWRLPDIDRKK